jgi:hypothetical protein
MPKTSPDSEPTMVPEAEQAETTTEQERVDATAEAVAREAAPAAGDDSLALAPWDRHEDVDAPLTAEQIRDLALQAQGLELVHTRGDGMVRTWADVEALAAPEPVDDPS